MNSLSVRAPSIPKRFYRVALTLVDTPSPTVALPATPLITRSGAYFSYQISGTNNPTSYTVTGLPSGFAFNPSTGVITQAPSANRASVGIYNISIAATNAWGRGAAVTLPLTVTFRSDFNLDRVVNLFDYNILIANYGTTNPEADANSNGIVNGADYNILVGEYGASF